MVPAETVKKFVTVLKIKEKLNTLFWIGFCTLPNCAMSCGENVFCGNDGTTADMLSEVLQRDEMREFSDIGL